MTTDLWLLVIAASSMAAALLGMVAKRPRPQPVRVQARPVNRSIER